MLEEELDDRLEGEPDAPSRERLFERHLECSECQKPTAVRYTELAHGAIVRTAMCANCPFLERGLYGSLHAEAAAGALIGQKGLVCGECGTSLAEIRTGSPLGCSHCYDLFQDTLVSELIAMKRLPTRTLGKNHLLHTGRSPGERAEFSPTLKLIALNEALSETLSREDYEQAAWIRDQIKQLTEKLHDPQ